MEGNINIVYAYTHTNTRVHTHNTYEVWYAEMLNYILLWHHMWKVENHCNTTHPTNTQMIQLLCDIMLLSGGKQKEIKCEYFEKCTGTYPCFWWHQHICHETNPRKSHNISWNDYCVVSCRCTKVYLDHLQSSSFHQNFLPLNHHHHHPQHLWFQLLMIGSYNTIPVKENRDS